MGCKVLQTGPFMMLQQHSIYTNSGCMAYLTKRNIIRGMQELPGHVEAVSSGV